MSVAVTGGRHAVVHFGRPSSNSSSDSDLPRCADSAGLVPQLGSDMRRVKDDKADEKDEIKSKPYLRSQKERALTHTHARACGHTAEITGMQEV